MAPLCSGAGRSVAAARDRWQCGAAAARGRLPARGRGDARAERARAVRLSRRLARPECPAEGESRGTGGRGGGSGHRGWSSGSRGHCIVAGHRGQGTGGGEQRDFTLTHTEVLDCVSTGACCAGCQPGGSTGPRVRGGRGGGEGVEAEATLPAGSGRRRDQPR